MTSPVQAGLAQFLDLTRHVMQEGRDELESVASETRVLITSAAAYSRTELNQQLQSLVRRARRAHGRLRGAKDATNTFFRTQSPTRSDCRLQTLRDGCFTAMIGATIAAEEVAALFKTAAAIAA